jgi:hypothetical protein
MRDGSPETEVSELLHWQGSHAPAPPFAQRFNRIAEANPRAKVQANVVCRFPPLERIEKSQQPILRLEPRQPLRIMRL